VVPALAAVAAVLGYGAVRLSQPLPATTFSTEIVQGNFAGGEKWAKGMDPQAFIRKTADKYLKLTDEHPDTDLVLWPETALPTYIRNDYETINRLTAETTKHHRYLMTGTINYDGTREAYHLYNAVTAFGPRGENLGFDAKRHLVPFGEYVPGRDLLPSAVMSAFGLMNIVGHDFTPGGTPHLFEFPFAKIGIGVCYDGIFPDAMRPAVLAGADVLALVTNDSWYKDTTAPRVLNAHAALRAAETKRYVLRAANTGICSIIEPTGRVVATTPVFQDATLVGRAAPMHELTLYTRWGDWASILSAFGFLAFLGMRWTTRKTNQPPTLS
jgi:apolipoprotein N-acyltransferase